MNYKRFWLPKNAIKKKQKGKGIDFTDLFDSRGGFDWDTTKGGTSFDKILNKGKEFLGIENKHKKSDNPKERKTDEQTQENKSDELRKAIEQHKREVLEQRREQMAANERNAEKARERRISVINSHSGNER